MDDWAAEAMQEWCRHCGQRIKQETKTRRWVHLSNGISYCLDRDERAAPPRWED